MDALAPPTLALLEVSHVETLFHIPHQVNNKLNMIASIFLFRPYTSIHSPKSLYLTENISLGENICLFKIKIKKLVQ